MLDVRSLAIFSLLLAGSLPAQAGAQVRSEAPVAQAPSAGGGAAAPVGLDNAAGLRGLGRVAIASFTVDILDRLEPSQQINGLELVSGAPSNLKIQHMFGSKPKRDPYISWGASLGTGFARLGFDRQKAVARALNAPLLNVRITVLGGQARIDRNFWASLGKVDGAMNFVGFYNRVLVVTPDGGLARIRLAEDMATDKLGDLVSTTGGGARAMQTAGNTAIAASRFLGAFVPGGAVIGQMRYSNSSAYELRTDPAAFEQAVTRGFGKISAAFASELAQHK